MTSPVTLKEWLDQVGLARLESTFRQNGVDLDILFSLTDGDLRELGLTLGDRKRVLAAAAAAALANSQPSPQPAPAAREEPERRQLTMVFCDL
ncbi:MAG TPA: SAM domain-containing protein, partial [Reyranella sp.]|nr:SAM domain-containing protein [Reyranella sp.]